MADERPRRDPTDAFRFVADEGCLVVVPDAAVVHVLNPVAGRIYSLLDGLHDENAIVRAVMDEFEVGEDEARAGYKEFVEDLRRRGMLCGGEDASAAAELRDE